VKDQLVYERLQDLVGANYSPSAQAVTAAYAASQQTIRASAVNLALETFKKKAEVKDDEISKYFDENKDTYAEDDDVERRESHDARVDVGLRLLC
jgi:hypothetical protein